MAWRPLKADDFVVRAGYGIFTSSYRGNITASSIIAPPYWTYESQSWSAAQMQRWETAWPVNPTSFVAPSVGAAAYDVKPTKDHEWNLSVQKQLWLNSALTVSYVGSYGDGLVADNSLNNVPPDSIQIYRRPSLTLRSAVSNLYVNSGKNWYNSGQLRFERRYSKGLSYMLNYAFSKTISENGADSIWTVPTPFAPAGYNRGIASFNRTHIVSANAVWDIPVGRGHELGGSFNPVADAFLGGWMFQPIYLYSSGAPLTFGVPGNTLGNGWGTRPNIAGDPSVSNPVPISGSIPPRFGLPRPINWGAPA